MQLSWRQLLHHSICVFAFFFVQARVLVSSALDFVPKFCGKQGRPRESLKGSQPRGPHLTPPASSAPSFLHLGAPLTGSSLTKALFNFGMPVGGNWFSAVRVFRGGTQKGAVPNAGCCTSLALVNTRSQTSTAKMDICAPPGIFMSNKKKNCWPFPANAKKKVHFGGFKR